jgi:uncharacterized membrane protein YidH (DUF202 family)
MSPEQKLRAVYDRLVSLCDEMLVIENYVRVNIEIFKRIVEEFDKAFADRSAPIGTWFVANLANEPFANIPFGGLFTVVSHLFSECSRSENPEGPLSIAMSVPTHSILRVKLLLSTLSSLCKPETTPDQLWQNLSVPLRSEELSHESIQPQTRVTLILFPDQHTYSSLAIVTPSDGTALIELSSGETKRISASQVAEVVCTEAVSVFTFQETRFAHARLLEGVRVRTGLFDFEAFSESFEVDAGFGNIAETRRQSTGSAEARPVGRLSHILLCTSSLPLNRLTEFAVRLPDSFSLRELEQSGTEIGGEEERFPVTPPFAARPMPSPLITHPLLPMSPAVHPLRPAKQQTTLIYPKNYMANERSFLAWVSAIAVQTGIGLALMGKRGQSFAGCLVCLVSLVFLWWAVYVFLQRFRQLKNPKPQDANVFDSMQLPTVFGMTQLLILLLQTLIFLW